MFVVLFCTFEDFFLLISKIILAVEEVQSRSLFEESPG